MAQSFKEKAHLNTDSDKYKSNYDSIFGKKPKTKLIKRSKCGIEKCYYCHNEYVLDDDAYNAKFCSEDCHDLNKKQQQYYD